MCASTSSQLQVTDTALRATERMGGVQGKFKKRDPQYRLWEGALGACTPPENFGILHALKCVMGASEAPFCACIKYIHTCKLPSSFSGFRSKVRHTGP